MTTANQTIFSSTQLALAFLTEGESNLIKALVSLGLINSGEELVNIAAVLENLTPEIEQQLSDVLNTFENLTDKSYNINPQFAQITQELKFAVNDYIHNFKRFHNFQNQQENLSTQLDNLRNHQINLETYVEDRENYLQEIIKGSEDNVLSTEAEINNYIFVDISRLIQDPEVYRQQVQEQQELLAGYQQKLTEFHSLQTKHQKLANHYEKSSWKHQRWFFGRKWVQDPSILKVRDLEQGKANIFAKNVSEIQKLINEINQQINVLNKYAAVIESANELFNNSQGSIEKASQFLSVIQHQNNLYNEIEQNYFQQAQLIESQRFQNQNLANWHNSKIRQPIYFSWFGYIFYNKNWMIGWKTNHDQIELRDIAQNLANQANSEFYSFQNKAKQAQQESNDLTQLAQELETRLYEHFPAFKAGIQAEIAAYLIQWQNQQNLQSIESLDNQQQLERLSLRIEQITADLNQLETELLPNQKTNLENSQQRFEDTRLQWQNILQQKIDHNANLQAFLNSNSDFLSDSEKLELTQTIIENNQEYIEQFNTIIEPLEQQLAFNHDENIAQQLTDYQNYVDNLQQQIKWASFQKSNFDLLNFDSENKSQINSLINELNSITNQGIEINGLVLENVINSLQQIKANGSNLLTAFDNLNDRVTIVKAEKDYVSDIFANLNAEYEKLSQLETDKNKLEDLISSSELEINELNTEKTNIIKKNLQTKSLQKKIDQLDKKIVQIQNSIEAKENQISKLTNEKQIKKNQLQLAKLQKQEDNFEKQKDNLETRLNNHKDIKHINDEFVALNDEFTGYQEQLDNVNQLLAEISYNLNDKYEQIQVTGKYINILNGEFNRLSIPHDLFNKFSDLTSQFTQAYNQFASGTETAKNALQSLVNIRLQGEDERNQLTSLESQLGDLETQLNDEIHNGEESESDIDSIQGDLALVNLQLANQNLHLKTLNDKTKGLLSAEKYFNRQADYHRVRMANNEDHFNAYQSYLSKASITRKEYDGVLSKIANTKQKIYDLEEQKTELKNQLNTEKTEVTTSNQTIIDLQKQIADISEQIKQINIDLEPIQEQEIELITTLFDAIESGESLNSNLPSITQQQIELSEQLIQLGIIASKSDINFFDEEIQTRIEQLKSELESRNQEFTTQLIKFRKLVKKWQEILTNNSDEILGEVIEQFLDNIQQQQETLTGLQSENTANITNLETELAAALNNLEPLREQQQFLILQELENNQQRQRALEAQLTTEAAVKDAINTNTIEDWANLNNTLSQILKDRVDEWTSNLQSDYLDTQELKQVKQKISQSFDDLIIEIKTKLADVQGKYELNTTQLEEALRIVDIVINRQDILAGSVNSTQDAIEVITKQLAQAEELQEKLGNLARLYELENAYQVSQKSKTAQQQNTNLQIEELSNKIREISQFDALKSQQSTIQQKFDIFVKIPEIALQNEQGKIYGTETFSNAKFGYNGFGTNHSWANQNSYPRHLADVNGDGKADIVGFASNNVIVALAKGDGTFDTAKLAYNGFGTNHSWANQNSYPRQLADVNGDGKADIVGFAHHGVYVALAKGNGTFDTAQLAYRGIFTVGDGGWANQDTYPRHLVDVNGDGMADIVGFAHHGVYVALAKGNGTFDTAQLAYRGIFTVGDGGWANQNLYPRQLADINGDGFVDIVGFASSGVYTSLSNIQNKKNEVFQTGQKDTINQLQSLLSATTNPLLIQQLVTEINEIPNRYGIDSEGLQEYIQQKIDNILPNNQLRLDKLHLSSALKFNGSNYVDVGSSKSLEVSNGITIEAWIKPSSEPFNGIIVNKEGEYEIARWTDGTIRWALAGINWHIDWINTGYIAPSNEWTHIALTYDQNSVKTYANGNLIHSYKSSATIGDYSSHINQDNLYIGYRQAGFNQYFKGLIDDVRVWNKAISQEEIQTNMYNQLQGNETGLAGYWNFEEGTGTTTKDLTSNGNNGTIYGSTWIKGFSEVITPKQEEAITQLQTLRLELAYFAIKSKENPDTLPEYFQKYKKIQIEEPEKIEQFLNETAPIITQNLRTIQYGINSHINYNPNRIRFTDIDGDNKSEALIFRPGSGIILSSEADEQGQITKLFHNTNGLAGYNLLSGADNLVTFDYDGDNDTDIFLYRPGRGAAWVARSNGNGTFSAVYAVGDNGWDAPNGIAGYNLMSPADRVIAFDYNGDNKDDLFLYRPGLGAAWVARSNGNGSFTPVYAVGDNGGAAPNGIAGFDFLSPSDIALSFDYNGDNKDDLFFYRPGRGAAYVARSNGDGSFTPVYAVGDNGGAAPNGIAGFDFLSPSDIALSFDYNGDNKDDLFFYRPGRGAAYVARSNGDGTFSAVYAVGDNGGAAPHGIAGFDFLSPSDRAFAFDYDEDGDDDLFFYRQGVNDAWIARSNGNGTFTGLGRASANDIIQYETNKIKQQTKTNIQALREQLLPGFDEDIAAKVINGEIATQLLKHNQELENLKNSVIQKGAASTAALIQANWYEEQAAEHWKLSRKQGSIWTEYRRTYKRKWYGKKKWYTVEIKHVDHHWIIWDNYTKLAAKLRHQAVNNITDPEAVENEKQSLEELINQWRDANIASGVAKETWLEVYNTLQQLMSNDDLQEDQQEQLTFLEELLPTLQSEFAQAQVEVDKANTQLLQEWSEYELAADNYIQITKEIAPLIAELDRQAEEVYQQISEVERSLSQKNIALDTELQQTLNLKQKLQERLDFVVEDLQNTSHSPEYLQDLETKQTLLEQALELINYQATILTAKQTILKQQQALLTTQIQVLATEENLLNAYLESPDDDWSNLEAQLKNAHDSLLKLQELAAQAQASSKALSTPLDDLTAALLEQNDQHLAAIKEKQTLLQNLIDATEIQKNYTLEAAQVRQELNDLELQSSQRLQEIAEAGSNEARKLLEVIKYNDFATAAQVYYRDYRDLTTDQKSSSAGGLATSQDWILVDHYYQKMVEYRQLQREAQQQANGFTEAKETAQAQLTLIEQEKTEAQELLNQLNQKIDDTQIDIDALNQEIKIVKERVNSLKALQDCTQTTLSELINIEKLNLQQAQLEQQLAELYQSEIDEALAEQLERDLLAVQLQQQKTTENLQILNQQNSIEKLENTLNELRSELGLESFDGLVTEAQKQATLAELLTNLQNAQHQNDLPENIQTLLQSTGNLIHSALQGEEAQNIQENLLENTNLLFEEVNKYNAQISELEVEEQADLALLQKSETDLQNATRQLYDQINFSDKFVGEKELLTEQQLTTLYQVAYAEKGVQISEYLAQESKTIIGQIIEARIVEREARKKAFFNELITVVGTTLSVLGTVFTLAAAAPFFAPATIATLKTISLAIGAVNGIFKGVQSAYNGDWLGAIYSVTMAAANFVTGSISLQLKNGATSIFEMSRDVAENLLDKVNLLTPVANGIYGSIRSLESGDQIDALLNVVGAIASVTLKVNYTSSDINSFDYQLINSLQNIPLMIHNGIQALEDENWIIGIQNIFNGVITLGQNFSHLLPNTVFPQVADVLSKVKFGGNAGLTLATAIETNTLNGWLDGINSIVKSWETYHNEQKEIDAQLALQHQQQTLAGHLQEIDGNIIFVANTPDENGENIGMFGQKSFNNYAEMQRLQADLEQAGLVEKVEKGDFISVLDSNGQKTEVKIYPMGDSFQRLANGTYSEIHIVIHGLNASSESTWVNVTGKQLKYNDPNAVVLVVDWGKYVGNDDQVFGQITNNVNKYAPLVAQTLNGLNVDISNTTIYGHSYGAHFADEIGEKFLQTPIITPEDRPLLKKLVLLDPATDKFYGIDRQIGNNAKESLVILGDKSLYGNYNARGSQGLGYQEVTIKEDDGSSRIGIVTLPTNTLILDKNMADYYSEIEHSDPHVFLNEFLQYQYQGRQGNIQDFYLKKYLEQNLNLKNGEEIILDKDLNSNYNEFLNYKDFDNNSEPQIFRTFYYNPELSEIDPLTGLRGNNVQGSDNPDLFIFNNLSNPSDINNNYEDYVLVQNFDPTNDQIQLSGSIDNYILGLSPQDLPSGTGIYLHDSGQNQLLGIIEGQYNLNLEEPYFKF